MCGEHFAKPCDISHRLALHLIRIELAMQTAFGDLRD
jgi:hypothetical protein